MRGYAGWSARIAAHNLTRRRWLPVDREPPRQRPARSDRVIRRSRAPPDRTNRALRPRPRSDCAPALHPALRGRFTESRSIRAGGDGGNSSGVAAMPIAADRLLAAAASADRAPESALALRSAHGHVALARRIPGAGRRAALARGMVWEVSTSTARACANIALIKYWGKRDARLNLPAAGSLSLTLDALVTTTGVTFDRALDRDELVLDGEPAGPGDLARTSEFLDLVRAAARISSRARVVSRNDFPTASGLASSASGYAALAVAAAAAAGLTLSARQLSILARRGSGSAARSMFGGFVRMHAGSISPGDPAEPASPDDGSAAYAEPIRSPLVEHVRMVIAVVGGGAAKLHGSRSAMDHTALTSPLYRAWIDLVPRDLAVAEAALAAGDLEQLGTVAEANALAMHACAIAARPAVIYWQPATLAALAEVRALRAQGVAAWATIDGGPHVKVLTTAADAGAIAARLTSVPGVTQVGIAAAGGAAALVSDDAWGEPRAVQRGPALGARP
jgi:diphosphomevalonate decarboxylase